jgi:hypothetical protein
VTTAREYVRDEVHKYGWSFNSILERPRSGSSHSSKEHAALRREVAFRWNQRVAAPHHEKGRKKTVMKALVIDKIANLLSAAFNVQIRWTPFGSIRAIA